MLLLALASSPIRRLAMNSRITKSRIIWSSERPLSSCKQQLCPFACATSLPAPSRAVSSWYPHKRDQPNNASCCCQSKLGTYSTPKKLWTKTPNSLYEQQTAYAYYFYRFPIPHNIYIFFFVVYRGPWDFISIFFKDVSREFDEFRVNTHLCKLRLFIRYHTSFMVQFYGSRNQLWREVLSRSTVAPPKTFL